MNFVFDDAVFRANRHLRAALQYFQLGLFEDAARAIANFRADAGDPVLAEDLAAMLRRARMAPEPGWTLVWRIAPGQLCESEWLSSLFGFPEVRTVVDSTRNARSGNVVVIDNKLMPEHEAGYRQHYLQGGRQVLVHISDEFYADSCSAYRWCDRVYRNHWSPTLSGLSAVAFFALGWTNGFCRPALGQTPPAAQRPHVWSFAGDPNKSQRQAMLSAMRSAPGGLEHLTSGWMSADSLSISDYRDLMEKSLFVPCPAGNQHLDTFRACEALEAGAIPILERRPHFDYFRGLWGDHPIPTVSSWDDAPALVGQITASQEAEALRQECVAWWANYKTGLKARIRSDLETLAPF